LNEKKKVEIMSNPIHAANNFIIRANECGETISHLKLQKLVYILYARVLAKTGSALFSNRFEAWPRGPALTDLYGMFRDCGGSSIGEPRKDLQNEIRYFLVNGAFGECFEEVWGGYARLSGRHLADMTREKDSAWSKTTEKNGGLLGGFPDDGDIKRDGMNWFS
jgi:uncharacterized phage-associated protein